MPIPVTAELKEIVTKKLFPISYSYSRLEGRPRADNFDRALKAEVRDPLWMLTKQWQMGEFEADDAGSPVVSKLCTSVADVTKYKAAGHAVQAFDKDVPFEAKVEQRALPFATLQTQLSLDLRLIMGRRWLQLINDNGLLDTAMKKFFLKHYAVQKPDPKKAADAAICAHPETWQQFAAVAGRMMDGAAFFADINTIPKYYDKPDFPLPGDHSVFTAMEQTFVQWYQDLFYQPADVVNDAYEPAQLEYQFSLAANTEKGETVLEADQYYQGHLDWYNLDVNKQMESIGQLPGNPVPPVPAKMVQTFIPTPITFDGMPNTRWWAFEDAKTNFSYIKPDSTDLAKLLLIEFGLVYANDWYMIPYRIPVGTLTTIKGLSLTNSFGENFWIEAAGKGDDKDWTRWNMFSMNVDAAAPVPADTDLLLLPTVPKIHEGKPVEEVVFIRDEMANMVWGVETIVPLPGGTSKSGFEASAEYHGLLQKLITDQFGEPAIPVPVADGDEEAKIRYEIMNSIPENWIPFIPAHVKDSNRDVQLQRAAMPRILEGNPAKPDKIRPRTSLLQEGLAEKAPYFIHEEEVPRQGIRVEQSFQRTRWNGGKVFVWYGLRKTTGRGEGSSGLGFDMILSKKTKQA
jgi:hypothetical protein